MSIVHKYCGVQHVCQSLTGPAHSACHKWQWTNHEHHEQTCAPRTMALCTKDSDPGVVPGDHVQSMLLSSIVSPA